MIHINATTFDLLGSLSIHPLPTNDDRAAIRRVSKVSTLDQGVAISDRGFAEGDEPMVFAYKPVSRAHDDIARRIVKIHATVIVTTREGAFLAAPESFTPGREENAFSLLVIRKLSED